MNTNPSPLGQLTQSDWIRGLVTAIIAGLALGVGTVMHGTITAPGFDLFAIDWNTVWHNAVNAALIGAEGGFVGYIGKNLMTNEKGDIPVLGKYGISKK